MEFQDWLFDRRVMRRNLRKQVITRDDIKKYLKALPDVGGNIADPDDDEDLRQDERISREPEAPEDDADSDR